MTQEPKRIFDEAMLPLICFDLGHHNELCDFIESSMREYADKRVREFAEKVRPEMREASLDRTPNYILKIENRWNQMIDLELAALKENIT